MFRGVYTAIISPLAEQGFGIHEALWRRLIQRQIDAGIAGIVVAGSTGEGQTLCDEEWETAIKLAAEYRDQIQIVASVGTSSTHESVRLTQKAEQLGAHAVLVSTPPYNKPPQSGLIEHFKAIAEASTLQNMLYNIPGRTAVNLMPETLLELWNVPNISGLKESSGDWQQFLTMQENCPRDKAILCGDDPSVLAFAQHGASGLVSVLSNVCPKATVELWNACDQGQKEKAQSLFKVLFPFIRTLFVQSNPIPTKFIVSQILGVEMKPRLPLLPLEQGFHQPVLSAYQEVKEQGWGS